MSTTTYPSTSTCAVERSASTATREAMLIAIGASRRNSLQELPIPHSQRLSNIQHSKTGSINKYTKHFDLPGKTEINSETKPILGRIGEFGYDAMCDAIEIQQMNQRASHFSLGSTSQNMGSVYTKDYNAKKAEHNDWKANNPFRGTSLGQGEQGTFATTNKTLLRAWDNAQRARLSDDKLSELKNHHFRLGSYAPGQALTTNKAYHDHKQISGEASKNQEESKNKMRTHNHDFKEQPFTNYRSAYANEYVAQEGGKPAEKVQGQQSGNAICFGSHLLPHVTTSGAAFTVKEGGQGRVRPEQTMGIQLGDKPQPMQTMNQLYYGEKNGLPASLPESTMKELRATHFHLGQNPQQYVTENGNYRCKPQTAEDKLTYKIPVYESGTWVDRGARFEGGTTNQRELPQREVKAFQRAMPANRTGIAFGGHGGSYASEFKDNFGAVSGVPNRVEVNKKSSVVIGGEGRFYGTEHKDSYVTHNLKEGRVDVDIKKLSKEDHFQIGGTSSHHKITVYKDEHRPDVENRNKLFHRENLS